MKKSCFLLVLGVSLAGCVGPGVYVDEEPYYGNNIDIGLGLWGLGAGYWAGHNHYDGGNYHGGGHRNKVTHHGGGGRHNIGHNRGGGKGALGGGSRGGGGRGGGRR